MHITEGRNKFSLRLKPFLLIMIRMNLAINFRLKKQINYSEIWFLMINII